MRLPLPWLTLISVCGITSVAAQTGTSFGLTAGTAQLTTQRSEQALSAALLLQATPWLSFSATPSVVHVKDVVSGRDVTSNGLGDLPVGTAVVHAFPGPSAPSVAAALTFVLPTGNAACGLGSGQSSAGLDVGFSVSPNPKFHVAADASRSVTNISSQSTLSAPRAVSVLVGGGYDLSPAWRGDVSLGVDVGQSDSTQALSRVLGAGLMRRLGGSLALTFDGSVGLTTASPKWVVSVGLGSAFAGTSPVGLNAPLRHLKSTFTGGVSRSGGSGKIGCS